MSKMQVADMLSKADTDGSGTIDYEEFIAYNQLSATKESFDVSNTIIITFIIAAHLVLLYRNMTRMEMVFLDLRRSLNWPKI